MYPYYKNKMTLTEICRKWGYPEMEQGPQGKCDVSLYGDGDGTFGQTIEAQLGAPEAVHEMLITPLKMPRQPCRYHGKSWV